MAEIEEIVEGGGLKFLTSDPFLKAAVRRCAKLEQDLHLANERAYVNTARFRTLRRDVDQIKKMVRRLADRPTPKQSEAADG